MCMFYEVFSPHLYITIRPDNIVRNQDLYYNKMLICFYAPQSSFLIYCGFLYLLY